MGLATEETRPALEKALEEIGRPELKSKIPESWWLRPYVQKYLSILDEHAHEEGTDIWLEKTPTHVHRLPLILRYVPEVHILHIVRDGRDVVGSICHRAYEYPERFADKQRDPQFGINRWNRSLRESIRYLREPGHTFVVYERFVQNPERTLWRICQDLGVSFESRMVGGTQEAANAVIPKDKGWIQRAEEPPEKTDSKFQSHFSAEEQRSIENRLNLDLYVQIRKSLSDPG